MSKKIITTLFILLFLVGTAWAATNINTANRESLDKLPGIGLVKAQSIIDYRTEHGDFGSVDELKNVTGIGPKTLEEIKDDITVGE